MTNPTMSAEEQNDWACKARKALGANDPQDCDWPGCGCDPYANRVLEALDESGYLRQAEQAAYERAAQVAENCGEPCCQCIDSIRALGGK